MKLRKHQEDCIDQIIAAIMRGVRSLLISAPCSFGKTIVFSMMAFRIAKVKKRILVIMDSVELVNQTFEKMLHFVAPELISICCGTLKSKKVDGTIVIGTVQTLERLELSDFDYVVIDEVHSGLNRSINYLSSFINSPITIGFTATPYDANGDAIFGSEYFFKELVYECSPQFLIENNYIVPCVYVEEREESKIDLSKVRMLAGEYNEKDIQEAYEKEPDKVDLQIKDMLEQTEIRNKIIVMATSIQHATFLSKKIKNSTVFHSGIDRDQNDLNMNSFKFGTTKYLIGISAIYKGIDIPCVDCLVIMRPIASKSFYVQFIGRGVRLFEGKKNALILDYGQVIKRIGFYTEVTPNIIGKTKNSLSKKDQIEDKKLKKCINCRAINDYSSPICSNCKFEFPLTPEAKVVIDKLDVKANSFVINLSDLDKYKYPYTCKVRSISSHSYVSKNGNRSVRITINGSPLNLGDSDIYVTDMPYFKIKNESLAMALSRGQSKDIHNVGAFFIEEIPKEITIDKTKSGFVEIKKVKFDE